MALIDLEIKLPVILYIVLLLFNLLSLYFMADSFICNGAEDFLGCGHGRLMFYALYVTLLSNLYLLCYIAIKKRFED